MSSTEENRKRTSGRRERPVSPESKRFGVLLREARRSRRCTQGALAAVLGVSVSFLAKIEGGRANHALTRRNIWDAIKHLGIPLVKYDALLEASGFSPNRTWEEEIHIQKTFPGLHEVWVFARHTSDYDEPWLATVKENLRHGVCYRYFVSDDISFVQLLMKLRHGSDRVEESRLAGQLECFVLPEELFFTNATLYNPGSPDMYCSGAKTLHGRSEIFFTNHGSTGQRIYTTLKDWSDCIRLGAPIPLLNMERTFPNGPAA